MTESTVVALLYVEDEFFIRDEVEAALAAAGFAVTVAADGTEALAALQADDAAFSGLVTDIDLGEGPNGWTLAREARGRAGGLPVVYVSGESAHNWTVEGVPDSVMIAKPFVAAQIVIAISTLLNAAKGPIAATAPE